MNGIHTIKQFGKGTTILLGKVCNAVSSKVKRFSVIFCVSIKIKLGLYPQAELWITD